jgi:hypothetical protein
MFEPMRAIPTRQPLQLLKGKKARLIIKSPSSDGT